jgi:hypothetical protein
MVHGANGVIKPGCEQKLGSNQPPPPTLCLLCDELSLRPLREIYYTEVRRDRSGLALHSPLLIAS